VPVDSMLSEVENRVSSFTINKVCYYRERTMQEEKKNSISYSRLSL